MSSKDIRYLGEEHYFKIRKMISKSKKKVLNFFKKYKTSSHLDGIIDGVTFGWVISSKSKEPVFEVLVNGKTFNKDVNFFPAPEIHPEAYRFYVDLKDVEFKEGDSITIIFNGKKIKGTPILLTNKLCFAKIDYFSANQCYGWAGTPVGDLPDLEVIIDGEAHKLTFEWFVRADFRTLGITVPTGFKFKIPEKYYDGRWHKVSLAFKGQTLCKEKDFCFYIKNLFIDKADSEAIAGWIQIGEVPGPLELDIYINNQYLASTKAEFSRTDTENIYGKGCYGFYYAFSEENKKNFLNQDEEYRFSLYIKDSKFKTYDSFLSISPINVIEALERVSKSLREKGEKYLCASLSLGISALRSILRHDPDIIMVGEIRDTETAQIAIQSALTGHLVLSTLHTNDSISTLFRLLDMGIEDYLINASLIGIIAQRIIRTICPYCAKKISLDEKFIEEYKIDKILDKFKNLLGNDIKTYKGSGCKFCLNTGFRGRIAIFEILPYEEELKEIFIKTRSITVLRDYLERKTNFRTLREDGIIKYLKGKTTLEEILRVTV